MILGSTTPLAVDAALEGLHREVADAQADDPLAPVTVVTPSDHAAVFVRRALGACSGPGGRGGFANITCTTVPHLLRRLGDPLLARRGLTLAPAAVDLEVISAEAGSTKGWLGQFSSHPSAVVEVQSALAELRRCPPATLDLIGRRRGRGRDLVALLGAVRRTLHHCGFADTGDVAVAARNAAGGDLPGSTPGALLTWQLGMLPAAERDILLLLRARQTPDGSDGANLSTLTEVHPCADPDEEARRAVRTIIAAAEAGVALWQQAVFHPAGPTYARILHQRLNQAGVASNGPELLRLQHSVTGRALVGLLDLAPGDWARHDVIAWLSAAPVTAGPHGHPVPAGRFDELSALAGIVRGPAQWHERLGHLAGRGGPEADDAVAMAAFMEELMDRTTAPTGSWSAMAAWAVALLDHYLRTDSDPERWPVTEEAAARQVRHVVSALGDLDRVSCGPDLLSFRRAVGTQLERTGLDTHDLSDGGFGDGVFLAPYPCARGLHFDAVVIAGLADALVPGHGADEGLLDDDLRRLDTSGTLPTRADRRAAALDDLRRAVEGGGRQRVATLPRGDPRIGRAQVPSRWLGVLVGPDTRWRPVDSFDAGLADADPAVSVRELELRERYRRGREGRDPAPSPTAGDGRLARGVEATLGRVGARFTRFDGFVGPGLVAAFDPGTPVSATRFETYAKCPRRYLFDRVLRVSERVRPEELWRIEPARRGTLVHAILEEYVAERVKGSPRSLDRLLAIAARRLDEAESGGLVGKPLLWRMDRAAILRDLRRFHTEEGDIEPIAAELSFGGDGEDAGPAVTVMLDDGRSVAFQGSVDRVDRTASGRLLVSDYKTGRQLRLSDLTRDPVAGGKLLQLPLYARAARDRFGGPPPVHARYWLLSGERSAPCFHLVITDQVDARFRHVVRLIADGVNDGCFPGVPGVPTQGSFTNCTGCDFDDICPTTRDRQWGRVYTTPGLRGVVNLVSGDVPDGLAGSVVKRFVDPDTATGP